MLAPGELIAGRYALLHRVGGGGMGEVWAARNQSTERDVALKFIAPSVPATPRMKARLLREARAAGRVKHESVVEVFDVLETAAGVPVIVMELIDGETLADHIAVHGALPVPAMANIMAQVVSAVGKAHERGVVHRDLKPSNIMLLASPAGSSPRVKVLDFGIAKMVGAGGDLTTIGHCVGTPAYMAPEQCRADPNVDHRADMWAIGIMIYELLAGERPVPGSSIGEVVEFVVTEGIPPLKLLVPDAPFDLAVGTRRLMERDPELRPRSLHEMATLLIGYTDRQAPEFGHANAAQKPVHAEAPALPAVDNRVDPAPSGRRDDRRGMWMLGAIGVAAVLLATGFVGPAPVAHLLHGSFALAVDAPDVAEETADALGSEPTATVSAEPTAAALRSEPTPAADAQAFDLGASPPGTGRTSPASTSPSPHPPAPSSTSERATGEGGARAANMPLLPWDDEPGEATEDSPDAEPTGR